MNTEMFTDDTEYRDRCADIARRCPANVGADFTATVDALRAANPKDFAFCVRHAAIIAKGTRGTEDVEAVLDPLDPLDENLNGDGGVGHIPSVELSYRGVNAEDAARKYVERLTAALREDARRACTTWLWTEWSGDDGYNPDIVDADELRRLLRRVHSGGKLVRGSGYQDAIHLHSFLTGMKSGDPMSLRGAKAGDHLWIHGFGVGRELNQFAEQVYAARELGIFVPPAAPEWHVHDGNWSPEQRNIRAIRAAIVELGLLREAGFRYGVVWDQENERAEATDRSPVTAQLIGPGTTVFPVAA